MSDARRFADSTYDTDEARADLIAASKGEPGTEADRFAVDTLRAMNGPDAYGIHQLRAFQALRVLHDLEFPAGEEPK